MSTLARRVLFSVIAAPLSIGLAWVGGAWWASLLAAAAGVGAWELFRIARAGGVAPLDIIGIPLAALLPLFVHATFIGVLYIPVSVAVVAALAVLATVVFARASHERPLASAAVTVFGVLYTGGTLAFGYALRYDSHVIGAAAGTALVIFPIWLTWSSDTGAVVVGRAFGKRKLIPSVSPSKTVAGAVGSLVLCVVMTYLYVRVVLRPTAQLALSPVAIVIFGVVMSFAAQVGDLAESLLKREAGMKDSSQLIPGHGGILDRLDAMFFTLPVGYVLLQWLLIAAPAP